jgi:hypothetical protein
MGCAFVPVIFTGKLVAVPWAVFDLINAGAGEQGTGCPQQLLLGLELAVRLEAGSAATAAADTIVVETAGVAIYSAGSGGHESPEWWQSQGLQ